MTCVPVRLSQDGMLWSVLRICYCQSSQGSRVPLFALLPAQRYFTTSVEEAPPASHYLLVPYFAIQGSPGVATVTDTHQPAELIAC